MTPVFGKTKGSAMLNLLRGLAAVMVCVGHWRNVLFVDYEQRTVHGLLLAPMYVLTSCGHQAVVIFFVLSGYLIAGSLRQTIAKGEWSWRRYGVARLTRLWVVTLPGLVLCALWDGVGLRSGWAPRLYAGLGGNHMIPDVGSLHTWAAFWRTALFLQGILGKSFGSNGPMWSLAYEFWYYVLFPLGLFLVMPGVKPRVRAVCAVLGGGGGCFQGREMLSFFPIWLAGAALAYLPGSRAGVVQRWATVLAYLPVFLLGSRSGHVFGPPSLLKALLADYLVGAATVGLIWVLVAAREEQTGARWERLARGLAAFSFTLYATHTPMLVLLAAWTGRDQRWQPDARHWAGAGALLAVLLGYAWVVAWATELRTDGVRRWAERLIFLYNPRKMSVRDTSL